MEKELHQQFQEEVQRREDIKQQVSQAYQGVVVVVQPVARSYERNKPKLGMVGFICFALSVGLLTGLFSNK